MIEQSGDNTISVHYFASSRDAASCSEETMAHVEGETIDAFRLRLIAHRPAVEGVLSTSRIALNDEFALDGDAIQAGDDLYIMPPVSGGAGAPVEAAPRRSWVVERDIAVGEASTLLSTEGAGGIATFTGVTRNVSQGQAIIHLDFEAHVPLATSELARIADEAIERFDLVDARVLHRIGHAPVGEVAVDIATSAAHRAQAFDGCRYIIDELKKRAPIWKREATTEGSVWVTPTP